MEIIITFFPMKSHKRSQKNKTAGEEVLSERNINAHLTLAKKHLDDPPLCLAQSKNSISQ